jgi:enoyl-CoA hydratase
MHSDEIIFVDEDGIATITLNRPDNLNAVSPELALSLRSVVDKIATLDHIGCVVLQGSGRSFCSGYDLKARERAREMLPPGFAAETITAIANLPQPVIAAVRGHCFTGGLELALAADFIIASDNARFADTHAKWSMRAAWGLTQRLPRRIGRSLAKEMMFTGREFSGSEAVAIGLANRCVPDADLEAETKACAQSVMARDLAVLRWIKDQVDVGMEKTLSDALQRERHHRPSGTAQTDERLRESGWKK